MNNEIKEKIKAYYVGKDINKVLDYITNLEKKLDKQSKNSYECGYKAGLIQAEIDNTMGVIEENSKLKSRIEKAVEYINQRFNYEKDTGAYHLTHTFDSSNVFKLWEILNGDDE